MKYSFETVTDNKGNKLYRDCLFVNLKTMQIQDHPDGFVGDPKDLVISYRQVPEGCILVDAFMAPIILELNKKGYRTIHSCQGYLFKDVYKEGEEYTDILSTSIIFEAPQPERYMENIISLPLSFEAKIENTGLLGLPTASQALQKIYGVKRYKEYNNKRVTIYSSTPNIYSSDGKLDYDLIDQNVFEKYAQVNRMLLASWVISLPDLTKEPIEKSNALYDERIIDKDTARQFGFEFDSVQEFASDIKQCHEVMVESINEINHEMSIINDMVESISIRLSNLGIVDDIRKE